MCTNTWINSKMLKYQVDVSVACLAETLPYWRLDMRVCCNNAVPYCTQDNYPCLSQESRTAINCKIAINCRLDVCLVW